MKHFGWVVLLSMLIPASLLAQATGGSKVGIIDFERAVVENAEGKKAAEKWNAKFGEHRGDLEKKQKELEEIENKLRTQDKALTDSAKAELTRNAEQRRTELARLNEDAQKELNDLRQQLLRPIAEKATKILNAYAAEQGFTVVFDTSNPQSGIIYAHDVADITTEIIRRVDAENARPSQPAKPKP